MQWTPESLLALAYEKCKNCHGTGRRGWRNNPQPCRCVLRNVFRACYRRFVYCVTQDRAISKVNLASPGGRDGRRLYERPVEDYIADFLLVSRRYLDELEYRIFRFHFLLGADWRLCCRRLKIEKGPFFHSVYRIQQRLGRVFSELRPFALYPVQDYFNRRIPEPGRTGKVIPMPARTEGRVKPVRPPLKTKDAA